MGNWLPSVSRAVKRWESAAIAEGSRKSFTLGCVVGLVLALAAAWIAGDSSGRLSAALAGLMTPLIAMIGAGIAYQQWRTTRDKLDFDRYPRRLEIYERVRAILGIIIRDADTTPQEMIAFWKSVSEADFLFGNDISEYLDEIYRRGMNLHARTAAHNAAAERHDKNFDFEKTTASTQAEIEWFVKQPDAARDKFRKYMQIR